MRDTPERHRGLRQAIAGSVTQLDDTQRGVFRRLGVFAGGWKLTAAEPVCLRDLPTDILDSVAALVDRSLVQRDRDPSSGQRFRMLETIREYALEELESSGEVEQAECAHATFYAGLAQQLEPELTLARPEAIRTIGVEIDNLNAALAWAVAHQETALALQLTTAAYAYWLYIGQVGEGRRWLEAALELPMADELPVLRARALAGLAGLVVRVAPQSAIDIASQALTVNQVAADPRAEGHAQFVLALASLQAGDDKRAARHTAAAREVARRSGQTYWEASALYLDAGIYERAGDRDAARAAFDRALALHESSSNLWGIARTRTLWAAFALREHDVEHACQLVLGALLAYQSLGSKWFEPDCFEMLAAVLVARGNPDAAARLLGAGAALHRIPHTSLSTANAGGPRAASRAQLGEAEFARAVAEGEALPASDAVAFALAVAGQASDSGSRPSENVQGLTPREQEVAALIARGLSSREIAEALVISVRTADSHADHIRDKLGLRTRAQIASWATANAARLPAG
ncbi:MAG: hypothetical protein JO057_07405 [Chloroflexi bacterium]|nr:hypothetical protein [Chloroflexota bacterium]